MRTSNNNNELSFDPKFLQPVVAEIRWTKHMKIPFWQIFGRTCNMREITPKLSVVIS